MLDFFFKDAINRRVDERLNNVLVSNTDFHFIDIDNKNAERVMTDFILEQQKKNNTELSTYDFVVNLRLPASQVSTILGEFEKKNLVNEVEYA